MPSVAERKGFALACGLGQGRLRPATGRPFTTDPFESPRMKNKADARWRLLVFGGEEGIRTLVRLLAN